MAQLSRLGVALRDHRRSGHTQASLSKVAGIGVEATRNLETGRGTLRSLWAVLNALRLELKGRHLADMPIGDALARLRQRRGISRRELARRLAVSRETLSVLEGGGPGRLETLESYGAAIGAGLYLAPLGERTRFYVASGNSSVHHGWETPAEIVTVLEQAFGRFDLDPCAASKGAARGRINARLRLTVEDDGLSVSWRGKVFVNPPYGRQLRVWVAKCATEAKAGAMVVGLIPARTDTKWWHDHIVGMADVFLLKGRLRFGDGKAPAPFPSAIVVWSATDDLIERLTLALPAAWHVPRGNLTET